MKKDIKDKRKKNRHGWWRWCTGADPVVCGNVGKKWNQDDVRLCKRLINCAYTGTYRCAQA